MALGRKVDHCIITMPGDDLLHRFPVGNIGSDKLVALTKAERGIGGGGGRTGLGQKVGGWYTPPPIGFGDRADEVTAAKSTSSSSNANPSSPPCIAHCLYPT